MKNKLFADALIKTESGRHLVAEMKSTIGTRMTHINELSHDTFVVFTKDTGKFRYWFSMVMKERAKAGKDYTRTPFDLFKVSKKTLKNVALKGGAEYADALLKLQYTWGSMEDTKDTIDMVLG